MSYYLTFVMGKALHEQDMHERLTGTTDWLEEAATLVLLLIHGSLECGSTDMCHRWYWYGIIS